ncbi:MAG: AbrB/MazE/SpoVT family DNA-binding domain-containing protein [Desulfurococcaceae archaeon]
MVQGPLFMESETRKIMRIGPRSSAVVLPSKWIRELGLKHGDRVKLFYSGAKIIITPLKEDELARGQIMIEGANTVASAKLKAAFLEGITNIKLKASYDEAIKLLQSLKEELPSMVFIASPEGQYHTVVFPDIGIDHASLLVKLCELFKKMMRREGELHDLAMDFNYTQLLLVRSLKMKLYEEAIDVADALDVVLFAKILGELASSVLERGSNLDEEVIDALAILVEQYYAKDLDHAVRIASSTLIKLDRMPPEIQHYASTIAELIFRKCIRDRACRCKHFFPKV